MPACGWTLECVLLGRIGAEVVAGVEQSRIDLQCLWRGGRPASSGSGGLWGSWVGWGTGAWWWWRQAGGFSNLETVTHCSLTPLAWVAKIVKSWTFINLPRRAD